MSNLSPLLSGRASKLLIGGYKVQVLLGVTPISKLFLTISVSFTEYIIILLTFAIVIHITFAPLDA